MLCLFNGGICVVGFINVLPCGKERLQVGMYWSEIASVKGLKRYLLVHNAGLFLSGRKLIVYRRSYAVAIFDFTTVEDVGEYKKQPLAHGFGRDRKVGGGGGWRGEKKKRKKWLAQLFAILLQFYMAFTSAEIFAYLKKTPVT